MWCNRICRWPQTSSQHKLFFTLIQLQNVRLPLSCFSECTARLQFPHTAEKQDLFSEAVILSPAPHKPEKLCNSGAEIKLHKLQHMGSESGESPIFQMQEYIGIEFCNKEAPSVFKLFAFNTGDLELICLVNVNIFHYSAFHRKLLNFIYFVLSS